jgi:hypothetical protein
VSNEGGIEVLCKMTLCTNEQRSQRGNKKRNFPAKSLLCPFSKGFEEYRNVLMVV